MRFASAELQRAWENVGNPNCAYYPDAVELLIGNRDQLPAPFVVQMDFIGSMINPHWRSIMEGSVPLCRCGIKRCVLPIHPCIPFVVSGEPIELRVGRLLEIALWGGDRLSTVIRLNLLADEGLLVERVPFAGVTNPSLLGFLRPMEDMLFVFRGLSALVADKPFVLGVGLADPLLDILPVFSITGVQADAVTLQLHAGVMRPENRPIHQCI